MSTKNPIVRLKPEINFSATPAKGGVRYIAEDSLNDRFWQLGALEYELCAVLDSGAPLVEALSNARNAGGLLADQDPNKIQKALAWLAQAGIVEKFDPLGEAGAAEQSSAPEPALKLFDPSFFRIPLLNADHIETITRPLAWLLTVPTAMIASILWAVGLGFAFGNSDKLMRLSSDLFVAGSQWWLLVAWLILKFVHELGHAVACARVGAKASSAGLGFMFFTPSPYVNVTSLWRVENRWSRILVSASGMLFELTLAAIAVIGACCFESPSLRYLCISIVTLGTFSTLMFNGNPLMKFDGYYILIDLIGRPNLWQDAQLAVRRLFASIFYKAESSARSIPMLTLYGIASWMSRSLTLLTMGWGLWIAWDGLGMIVVLAFIGLWFVVPRLNAYWRNPQSFQMVSVSSITAGLDPKKCRSAALVMGMILAAGWLPSPFQIYWPGVVDYVNPSELRADAPGVVAKVLAHDGQGVSQGDVLLELSNPQLQTEYSVALRQKESSEQRCNMLRAQRKESELQAEEANCEALRYQCESLKSKVDSLSIRAPRSGVLMARDSQNLEGTYLDSGASIGLIVDPRELEVRGNIPQEEWDTLSRSHGADAYIVLSNGEKWGGQVAQVLPRSTDILDNPSLGGVFGGPLSVFAQKDESGSDVYKTVKPRLQARLSIAKKGNSRSSAWRGETRNLPPSGIHCSFRLNNETECIWRTVGRWVQAALHVQFKKTTTA